SVAIRWAMLGPSRRNFAMPHGQVAAEVIIRPAGDGRSVIFKCKIDNQSAALVPQVLFPDLHGLKAIDGAADTQLRFGGGVVRPFTEDPIPADSAQFYIHSGWKEYAAAYGVYGPYLSRGWGCGR